MNERLIRPQSQIKTSRRFGQKPGGTQRVLGTLKGGRRPKHWPRATSEWRSFDCSDEALTLAAEAFQEDGAVCLRGAFGCSWLECVAEGIKANQARPSELGEWIDSSDPGDESRFFSDLANWQRIPQFESFARQSGAARIARLMMGSKVAALYHEHVLVKEEGRQPATPWHQDQAYYPVDGQQLCSIWLPADPVAQEVSLEFVRGSHAWGQWFVPRKFATGNEYQRISSDVDTGSGRLYDRVPDIGGDPHLKKQIISWAIEPGDCIVFHGMTLHGTRQNQIASRRRVLSTRWVGEDATFSRRPWEFSPPIMGTLVFGDKLVADKDQFPTLDT